MIRIISIAEIVLQIQLIKEREYKSNIVKI